MRTRLILLLSAIAALALGLVYAQPPEAAHRFQLIAPGVYGAIGTGTLNVGSNSCVIVNRDDVLIVDSHITPESARALLREMKTITDKPVRTVTKFEKFGVHAGIPGPAQAAGDVAAEPEADKRAQDQIQAGQHGQGWRGVPPSGCRRGYRKAQRSAEHDQYEEKR